MGWRQVVIKCTECKKETALIGEDIDKAYTIDYYQRQGWVFTKYGTMCPECREKERKRWEEIGRPEQMTMFN